MDRLWDARDVAWYLRVSLTWVYQRAEAGLLPCLRVGGMLRFEPAAVCAWALDMGIGPGAASAA